MEKSYSIHQKLEAFIKKYYTNELIRGIIFFIGLGLIYFLFTLFIEYFLWLKPQGRTFLFWFFITVEAILLFRFILFPIFKILKFQKGIDYTQASVIIGSHFSEVNDTLTNYLQLSKSDISAYNSELLLASIEQKANSLRPIPFGKAIDFSTNRKYLPLAILPILFLLFFFLSGNSRIISQSLNRVVHFNSTFAPPAPFKFTVLNSNLVTEQGKDFVLQIKSVGAVVPENVMIFIGDESYYLETIHPGEFQFKIAKPITNVSFHLGANAVVSPDYELKVIAVPTISNFEMKFVYPSYLNLKSTIVKGTGNGIIPEGTQVTWVMNTNATQSVVWKNDLLAFPFAKSDNTFNLTKNIVQNTEYQIITSNNQVKNFEKLNYQLNVVKDQFPSINITKAPDSLNVESSYFVGQIADDYGLSRLQIVYYESGKPLSAKRGTIAVKHDTFDQIVFNFPSNLDVEKGVNYDFYFEVFDNDAIHHFKSSRSTVFSNRILSDEEKQNNALKEQNNAINSLQKTLSKQDKQFSEMEKLQQTNKEKEGLDFNDRQKINDFIKQQQQQNELMKQFSNKMKDNLDKSNPQQKDDTKELLQKRLDNTEKELDKNKKLLDELKELNNKIKDEDFVQKLEKFKENSKNQNKNLAQLVELTKRYYVEKKAEQLADKLDKLSQKEDKLSENEKENSAQEQKKLTDEFEKIQEELKQLDKDNEDLKSPMDIPSDSDKEKSIKEDLNKANSDLQNNNKSKAKPSQKSASKKMKEMSKAMEQAMEESSKDQIEEDVKMLRQILDNLLAYSFSQEDVMNQFKATKLGSPSFGKYIRNQQNLKTQFKHIDDSLFALSLRQPKIAESVTKEVAGVQYNIDKSLESLTESQLQRGLSQQQYAISSANKLADLLSDSLNSMQMQMSGSSGGKPKPGQGSGMQLPDIIKKQGELSEKMKQGMKPGNKPGEGNKPGDSQNKGSQSGKGQGQSGESEGDGEGDAKATMDIYKEQKQLREALQEELNKKGVGNSGQNALEQMKQLEKQLLNKGFNNETLQRTNNIKQELLKLDTAIRLQGEDPKRQSETNTKNFTNQASPLPKPLSDYLNSIEILNRQSLPLRSNFNQKVQVYFNNK
ncbi:hypothetical protein C8C85_1670 [Flavobacterium sp. 103]|uniref:hypothetical protein n=1 Tax=Flavobacterium sp. 103 TaxID=2135624 RepID=UPI000D5E4F0B|nr:hypothetical protein [Flavobacterium sp. 103]PVX45863.1 hypothetical protein C8C85_1670 [Flavobacterium sp. 103]